MASANDRQSLGAMAASSDAATLIPKIPKLPEDVKKRFPSLFDWERDMEAWRVKTNVALRGGN